jgi:hypothetical protein
MKVRPFTAGPRKSEPRGALNESAPSAIPWLCKTLSGEFTAFSTALSTATVEIVHSRGWPHSDGGAA